MGPRIENKPQGQTIPDDFDEDEGGDDEVQNSEQERDGNEDEDKDEEMDFSEEMLTPLTIIDGHGQ